MARPEVFPWSPFRVRAKRQTVNSGVDAAALPFQEHGLSNAVIAPLVFQLIEFSPLPSSAQDSHDSGLRALHQPQPTSFTFGPLPSPSCHSFPSIAYMVCRVILATKVSTPKKSFSFMHAMTLRFRAAEHRIHSCRCSCSPPHTDTRPSARRKCSALCPNSACTLWLGTQFPFVWRATQATRLLLVLLLRSSAVNYQPIAVGTTLWDWQHKDFVADLRVAMLSPKSTAFRHFNPQSFSRFFTRGRPLRAVRPTCYARRFCCAQSCGHGVCVCVCVLFSAVREIATFALARRPAPHFTVYLALGNYT